MKCYDINKIKKILLKGKPTRLLTIKEIIYLLKMKEKYENKSTK